jgi:hypothetical protein
MDNTKKIRTYRDVQYGKNMASGDRYQLNYFICIKDFNAETNTSLKLNLFSFFICDCQHHQTVLENISNFSAIIVFHCDSLAKISHLKTYFPIFFVFFFSTLFCITYYWTCDKIDNFIFLVYYYVFLGPPPVTSPGKPRRDSDNSNHSQEVFSGGEDVKDEPRSPVSPAHRDESAAKLIPAPPPVVNVWEKRKTETVVKTAVVSVKSPMEAHTHVKSETRSIADAPVCLFYYWWPSWLEVRITGHNVGRGPS